MGLLSFIVTLPLARVRGVTSPPDDQTGAATTREKE
jgi:hypothetical protein